jgi:hypothetical protein
MHPHPAHQPWDRPFRLMRALIARFPPAIEMGMPRRGARRVNSRGGEDHNRQIAGPRRRRAQARSDHAAHGVRADLR